MIPARIADRLKLDLATGCRIWTGATDHKGYGVVWFEGRRRKLHRVLFRLRFGRWPLPGMQVLHGCSNRLCGEHLREGTQSENELDKRAHGTARGHFIAGGGRAA